jgi:uncharacterized 2Fe-2S/4Fe-4S cluster protein (DUF4445 family)
VPEGLVPAPHVPGTFEVPGTLRLTTFRVRPYQEMSMPSSLRFEPWGVELACEGELTLLDAARRAEIPVGAVCGGRGTCGKCQVRLAAGPVPPPTPCDLAAIPAQALERGFRLACQHRAVDGMTVETLQMVAHGKDAAPQVGRPFEFSPPVRRSAVEVPAPSLSRPVDDASNLLAALEAAGAASVSSIDYRVAQELPRTLRGANWRVAASLRGGEVIALRSQAGVPPPLGMAVDLGTTNIVSYLYNLSDGALLDVRSASNPLAPYGADIISRLSHAQLSPENGARLQRILVKALNLLVERSTETAGGAPGDVEEVVVVGNSGMHHLFLNLAVGQLIGAPYIPAVRHSLTLKARELGLTAAPGAYAFLPPLVGGFVGSDLLAVALVVRLERRPGIRLALDIGTNTELLLSVNGQLYGCSTASGPALEGAALQYGSVAMPGAVDRVWLEGDGPAIVSHTLKNRPAIGICGSGIIDALACMHQAGILSRTGRMQAGQPGVREQSDGDHRYVLVPAGATGLGADLTISQSDVRAIQLAKGAIRAGIETLLSQHGLGSGALDEVVIAGAFGSALRVESALAIGLLPPLPAGRIRQVGNAAGAGAGLMLLSVDERREAELLSKQIRYMELAGNRRFNRLFAHAQWF